MIRKPSLLEAREKVPTFDGGLSLPPDGRLQARCSGPADGGPRGALGEPTEISPGTSYIPTITGIATLGCRKSDGADMGRTRSVHATSMLQGAVVVDQD
jgi:hypothetical protein